MSGFIPNLVLNFFIALGVILGGSLFGSLAASLCGEAPLLTLINVAERIKIWAVAIALGGTFSSFRVLEQGLFRGEFKSLVRQFLYIITAMAGAQVGYLLLYLISGSEIKQ